MIVKLFMNIMIINELIKFLEVKSVVIFEFKLECRCWFFSFTAIEIKSFTNRLLTLIHKISKI